MKIKDLVGTYSEYTLPDELIEKLEPPKPKTIWDLEKGDKYVLETETGEASSCEIRYIEPFELQLAVGNVFLTKEEALKDIRRRKVEALLLKHGGRRWFKKNEHNWYVSINCSNSKLYLYFSLQDQSPGVIYFDSREELAKAISEIGEGRIAIALFEVK